MRKVENYEGGILKKARGNIPRVIQLSICCFWSTDFFNRIMEDEKETLTSAFKRDVSNFALHLLPGVV